jgi:hypothetical protein
MKLGFPGQSTFTRLQRRYLVPAIDEVWASTQGKLVEGLMDKELILLGEFL